MANETEHLVLWKLSQIRRAQYEFPEKFWWANFLNT